MTTKLAIVVVLCLMSIGLLIIFLPVSGAQLLFLRSISMTTGTAGATADYVFSADLQLPETLGSLRFEFCSNNPIINSSCTPPTGFDVSNAALAGQSGVTDFSANPTATSNTIIFTRTASAVPAGAIRYLLTGINNPSAIGSYYVRVQTFASEDATGPDNDEGGLALATTPLVSINAEVPPYLLFCSAVVIPNLDCDNATGAYLNIGNLTTQHSSGAESHLLVATNAQNGYSVGVSGTTLTSGNNVIPLLGTSDVSRPGTSQFGINLRANTDPLIGADVTGPGSGVPTSGYAVADKFGLHSGDVIASSSGVEDYRKYTVSYLINIAASQPPGVYASTLTYTASGNF